MEGSPNCSANYTDQACKVADVCASHNSSPLNETTTITIIIITNQHFDDNQGKDRYMKTKNGMYKHIRMWNLKDPDQI